MHYFGKKFSKVSQHGALRFQRHLIFDFCDLKLRDLAKLWFFKLIMTKSNFKKSVMTLFRLLHFNYIIEIRQQNSVTKLFHFGPIPSKFVTTPVATGNFLWY